MIVAREDNWIKCESINARPIEEEDGKWIAYIRRAYGENFDPNSIILAVDKLTSKIPVGRAWISKYHDVAIFFTQADQIEIYKTKKIIQEDLQIKDCDLFWKAHFETDYDWNDKKGLLWHVNGLAEAYDKVCLNLRQGNSKKAERIEKK